MRARRASRASEAIPVQQGANSEGARTLRWNAAATLIRARLGERTRQRRHFVAEGIGLDGLRPGAQGSLRRAPEAHNLATMTAYVYILTNRNHTTLYVGMTSGLEGRMKKHREKFYPRSFSAKYNLCKLVYFEVLPSVSAALAREKQLKAGSRKQKLDLIEGFNPEWIDLIE